MDFWKLLGSIFIVISGTFGGIYFSLRCKKRAEFLEQYRQFLTQTQTMIHYGAMSVREILRSVKGIPLIEPILRDTGQFLDNGWYLENAWKQAVDIHMKEFGFSLPDREMLYFFGSSFGVTDKDGEIAKIQLHDEIVKGRSDVLKEEISSKCRIYRIVGMFCGVLTAVMIC